MKICVISAILSKSNQINVKTLSKIIESNLKYDFNLDLLIYKIQSECEENKISLEKILIQRLSDNPIIESTPNYCDHITFEIKFKRTCRSTRKIRITLILAKFKNGMDLYLENSPNL